MVRIPLLVNNLWKVWVNLASRSRIRNVNWPARSSRSISRFRACWAVQAPVGLAVTPKMCTRRVSISMTKKTYRRFRKIVSTCRKSHAKIPEAWEIKNCRQVGDDRRGAESGLREDPADRALTDSMAKTEELALDPSVSPSRVLPRQPYDQVTDLVGDRWSSGLARIGPLPLDQPAMPGQQGAGRHDPMRAQ